jgi:hypothetical protein
MNSWRASNLFNIDFHADVQEPVNIRVPSLQKPSIFLLFDLFAPISWPFIWRCECKFSVNVSHPGALLSCVSLHEKFDPVYSIKWNIPH